MSSVRQTDLYQTLSIPKTASLRKARRLTRRIHRSEQGSLSDVADVAEQVLGDIALRARYDRILDRLRAASVPVPTIGTVVMGQLPPPVEHDPSTESSHATPADNPEDAAKPDIPPLRIGANLKPDTGIIKVLVIVGILIAVIVFLSTS